MFDQYIYKRTESNLDVSLSVPHYNGQHGPHYNMNDHTFHTPSFGDEEFDIPTMNSHLHSQHQQQQHQQPNHQQQQPQQHSHQTHQIEQHQYQMHNNGQPPPHIGMLNDQQQPQQQQYTQWHQDSHLNHHSPYPMQSPNQPTYHQLNSPSPNNPNATLHVLQPPQQSPQMSTQMSPPASTGAPVGGSGGFVGRSPPQASGHHIGNNEPGTTSEDSDDAIPTNTLKRPSPEPVFDGDSSRSKSPAASLAKKPKVAKKKKKRDPNEPQKPVSAYALFFRDTQAAIKGRNPNASFGEVSKIVASMWDVLATEHKNVYKKKTEAAKKEYLKALAAYRASLVSKGTEGEQQQPSQQQQQPMYSPPPPSQQLPPPQQQQNHMVNHSQPSPQHGQPVPQVSPHMPGQGSHMPQQSNNYPPPYASPYKSPQQTMMQMQPHLQHHNQPTMHPGQAQVQPPPHHMQINAMAVAQQQQQMMGQQPQMGMSPQQQHQQQIQQNHLTSANINGMMNMGMTPPHSHYMNQQMHSQQQGQQHSQITGHPMQQQQQQQSVGAGGHMSPHQVAPPVSGSPTQQNVAPQQCIRHGCQNPAIVNSDWEDEYCSNECVITHCRDVFGNWVQTNNSQQQTYSAVK
ncbi:TOX high mobility group box family member 3-like isoform X2 [Wyeomyia smithii]|nr:TOX high mobility group box family member 3-like isoform X2 [Wyeomyia smithii]XP_055526681.1 TOX high mobility group box family member 3-like isoform X2 [Wyeomyia smithii]